MLWHLSGERFCNCSCTYAQIMTITWIAATSESTALYASMFIFHCAHVNLHMLQRIFQLRHLIDFFEICSSEKKLQLWRIIPKNSIEWIANAQKFNAVLISIWNSKLKKNVQLLFKDYARIWQQSQDKEKNDDGKK